MIIEYVDNSVLEFIADDSLNPEEILDMCEQEALLDGPEDYHQSRNRLFDQYVREHK